MPKHDPSASSARTGLLAAALGLALFCFLGQSCKPPAGASTRRARLATELDGLRRIEGRLVGGFAHSPFDRARAAATAPSARPGLQRLAREIANAVARTRSPAALGDSAVLDLSENRLDRAISKLEEATAQASRDAGLSSDLAAAYLARAARGQSPYDFVLALTAADQAVLAEGSLPEARFNRALACERLFLTSEAQEAWQDYLRIDHGSSWADEARAHLSQLAQPSGRELWPPQRDRLDRAAQAGEAQQAREIVARFPQPAREHVEEELLPAWSEARSRGDADAAGRLLRAAHGISMALAARNGEHLPEDAVAAVEQALQKSSARGRLDAIVEGQKLYGRACPLLNRHEIDAAYPLLLQARDALTRGASPLADWARLRLVVCAFERSELGRVADGLAELRGSPRLERARSLRGRVLWITGLSRLAGADPSTALAASERARELFRESGERENLGAVESNLAENLRYLGEDRAAWTPRYHALSLLADFLNPRRIHATLEETAQALVSRGQTRTALYFRNHAVDAARLLGDPTSISHALLKRSEIRSLLHDEPGAAQDIADAKRISREIVSLGPRQRVEADILLSEGEAHREDAPGEAIRSLTQALGYYTRASNHFSMVPILLARGRAYLTLGQGLNAENDFAAGIAEFEQQRKKVLSEQLRTSYFDQSITLFDQMTRLQAVSRHRPDLAFSYSERGRARGLLDHLRASPPPTRESRSSSSAGASRPLTIEEVQRALPLRGVLVELAVLDDRLLAWVIRRTGTEAVTIAIRAADLAGRVRTLRFALEGGGTSEAMARASSELYARLIEPLSLQGDEPVVFLPDKSLHAVPFPALRNPRSGRYLIEERAVGIAPSATLYVRSLRRDRQMAEDAAEAASSVLVLGDPTFDTSIFPGLSRLPGAEAEADSVAALYPQSEILKGTRATKAALLAAAGRHTVVHIAAHAIVNPEFPLLSRLALAPAPGDSGSLFAHELYGLRWPRTRLVLLSACGTGSGEAAGSEGVSSLVRPFLAAGVPTVVASLWNVDDRMTALLLVAFHRQLRNGLSPLSALRSAQLELLRDSRASVRSPASWAAFEVFGGVHEN